MNIDEMASNECVQMPVDEEPHLNNIQLHEISEAINQLDIMISDLERALHIDGK